MAGLLAFMSVTGYAGMTNLQKLSVEIEPPAELYAGAAAPFTIRVRNGKRRFPSFLLSVDFRSGTNSAAKIPVIERNGEAPGTASICFPQRGVVAIDTIRVTSPFPVGFFFRYCDFRTPRTLLVFPRLLPCDISSASSGRARSGERTLRPRGMDGELERISPYSGREPLKMIHWKISGRSEELMVKEFGTLSGEPVIIDLNELPPAELERKISCAAWLVRRWVESRPVGLRTGDRNIACGTGRRHGVRLLTELALIGADGKTGP